MTSARSYMEQYCGLSVFAVVRNPIFTVGKIAVQSVKNRLKSQECRNQFWRKQRNSQRTPNGMTNVLASLSRLCYNIKDTLRIVGYHADLRSMPGNEM